MAEDGWIMDDGEQRRLGKMEARGGARAQLTGQGRWWMERGQKLGVKYLFPWVLAPLRVGLASVSVVTGRELRGVLIADQLARASVVCRGAAHPVVEGRTTPDLPGGLRTGVRGCWWCENWKSRWREGGSSSKPCRIGNHAGFVSTGQSPKTPTVSLSPCLLFFPGKQHKNHGLGGPISKSWWLGLGHAVCGSTSRLGLSHTPESQPVCPSCLVSVNIVSRMPDGRQLTSVLFELLFERRWRSGSSRRDQTHPGSDN